MLTPQDIFQFLAYAAIATVLAGLFALLITVWTVVYHVSQPGKRLRNNLIATPLALLAAFAWAYIASSDDRARQREMQAKAEARQKEYLASKAIFEERCKSAGEKIYQTVENVEGITLLNVPKESTSTSFNDPMWENAALPQVGKGKGYIRNLLNWEIFYKNDRRRFTQAVDPRPEYKNLQIKLYGYYDELDHNAQVLFGYKYIDVKEQNQYFRYKYPNNNLRKDTDTMDIEYIEQPSRYALDYKPIIDPLDRKHWIAGLRVDIYDLKDNSLMASKTWYSIAPGQGHNYQTDEWAHPSICPEEDRTTPIRFFVTRVIKPKQGD